MVSGSVISSTAFNALTADIATGLSTCILKDGTQTVTANIPMAGFKFTGLGAGSASGNSLRYEQVNGVVTTLGDWLYASAAGTFGRVPAAETVAAHATTCDPWGARVVTLSGSAVTFTDLADADYVGQRVLLLMNAAHIWTDGAVFDVQGGATYTTAAGDWVELVATAVDAFDVTIFPANGGIVASKGRVPITLATEQASTSGTAITFSSIPAGVRRITIMFKGVSVSGTDNIIFQIGDTDGVENSGYLGSATGLTQASAVGVVNYTTGFGITNGSASNVMHGQITLTLEDASDFTWTAMGCFGLSDSASWVGIAGSKSLSAVLDRVVITTLAGSDTFDAGVINVSYE